MNTCQVQGGVLSTPATTFAMEENRHSCVVFDTASAARLVITPDCIGTAAEELCASHISRHKRLRARALPASRTRQQSTASMKTKPGGRAARTDLPPEIPEELKALDDAALLDALETQPPAVATRAPLLNASEGAGFFLSRSCSARVATAGGCVSSASSNAASSNAFSSSGISGGRSVRAARPPGFVFMLAVLC